MKNIIDSTAHVLTTEKLIPANVLVLGLTAMDIDMLMKLSLTGLMIVLTVIKIYKELKNKGEKE
jgi:hypothetical protein